MVKGEGPLSQLAGRVYDDLAHPAAKQIGDAIGRAFAIALAPSNGVLWSMELAMAWAGDAVKQRLIKAGVPAERVLPPAPGLLAAVVTGVQVTAGEPALRDMFANLLASAMDSKRAHSAHPAFANIIRELLPEEAALLDAMSRDRGMAGVSWLISFHMQCDTTLATGTGTLRAGRDQHAFRAYCDNLIRLGLVVPRTFDLDRPKLDELRVAGISDEDFDKIASMTPKLNQARLGIDIMTLNNFGEQFLCTCTEVGTIRDIRLGLTTRDSGA